MPPTVYPATAMPDSDWWETLWPDPNAVIGKLGSGPTGTSSTCVAETACLPCLWLRLSIML
jgi:hypothetical protein